ncbi:MAG: M15 family metallopeptidase [Oscillospiraceae bacterium]|jgi:D-alanyl-D-alanine dipeptidase/carboxypeptidase|nr:M15 family metallopeptidase [Oscillospiraceae bacterium]
MSCGIHSGLLVLVNAEHPIRRRERPVLAPAAPGSDVLLDTRAAAMLTGLISRLGAAGEIVPVSGWRSMREQREIWDGSMAENGTEFTRKYVALPGCSEHQTGLAIDLALRSDNIDFIRPDFPYDGICGRFRALAADYGFIERYQAGKEHITGIAAEPWHFRYVGRPHARLMSDNGLCLEEYVELLRSYPYPERLLETRGGVYEADVGFAFAKSKLELPDAPYQISGNNVDGYIYTLWRKPA